MPLQPEQPIQPEPTDRTPPTELAVDKAGHRFVFRYRPGEEGAVLDDLHQMAGDPDSRIDWFDAAMLSHQVGQHLAARLQGLVRAPAQPRTSPDDSNL